MSRGNGHHRKKLTREQFYNKLGELTGQAIGDGLSTEDITGVFSTMTWVVNMSAMKKSGKRKN